MGNPMNTFGDRLKKEREAKGLTQEELARAIGVAVPTISEYESGKKMPRLNKIIILARKLGVSIDYLLGETDIKEPAHLVQRPKITDLREYIKSKYPTKDGKLISEEEARVYNKLFEKIFEIMAEEIGKKNGTNGN